MYKDIQNYYAWRRKTWKKRRDAYFADKFCVDCGAGSFLELDHVDPSQKKSHRIWLWSKERREAELAKCVVRCDVCHDKRHKENGGRWRMMRPGGGKTKGSAFEREMCEKLSLWLSHEVRKDLLCRTVGSGGQFTAAINRGTQAGLAGDLRSQDPLADKLCSKFVLECKFWKDLELIRFLNREGELFDAMVKVRNEGVTVDKSWMLLAKQNQRAVILFIPTTADPPTERLSYHAIFNETVYMYTLNDFLKEVSPEGFLGI